MISVAIQDSHLFSASIRDNVGLRRPDAGNFEIEHALRRARIWCWSDQLPDRLDTLVGEEGRELFGGHRQRIALARALLADARVLVLDEPTAHLDPSTVYELVRDVLSAATDRTVMLITHQSEGPRARRLGTHDALEAGPTADPCERRREVRVAGAR